MPAIALLDVDAGKWKLSAMHLVQKYLAKALPDTKVIA